MRFFDSIKEVASKAAWTLKKKSPEVCLVTGIVTTVGAVIFACRATVKATDVADEYSHQMSAVHKCEEAGKTATNEEYTKEDARKDIFTIKVQTGVKILKLFAPAIIFLGGSIVSQIAGYKILSNRLALASAAYAALSERFSKYRGYIRDEYGDEVDRKAFHNIKAVEKPYDTGEKDENGTPIMGTHMVDITDDDDYSALFDECSREWEPDFEQNLTFLRMEQDHWTTILKTRNGRPVFLNEVRARLGLPLTQMGQVVGWRYDTSPNHKGDNKVLFGIDTVYRAYKNGEEMPHDRSFLLDFNVDGNILYAV